MDRPKNSVVKSKSSNSAITSKSESQKNKKSRSNAEIQPLTLKKRGVYVEKKLPKLSVNTVNTQDNNIPKKQIKSPTVPRPNKKRFLNSILTILSKSTAATQYPDTSESVANRRCERISFRGKNLDENNIETAQGPSQRKKYRSKTLNEHKNDLQQLYVLQSKREIVNTPSENSQRSVFRGQETVKWAELLPPLVNTNTKDLEKSIYENANEGIAKEVLEGLKVKEKVKLNDKEINESNKDDKGLYNFFVDLLESTFSIYNVKTEYDAVPNSSNPALEIDEEVAERLNVGHSTYDDFVQNASKHFCCVPEGSIDTDLLEYFKSQKPKKSKCSSKSSGKLTRSFNNARSKFPVTESYNVPDKKLKKNRKKELLDSIKDELRMDAGIVEEPQNLFQALRVMARNKRKEKTIRFDGAEKSDTGSDIPYGCVFKRRKVISFSTKSSKKSSKFDSDVMRSMMNNYSDKSSTIKGQRADVTTDESAHSLEVYGFDYESPTGKQENDLKQVILTYRPSRSGSYRDFNVTDALLKYSESGTSSVQNYVNCNRGIRPITRVVTQP